MPKAKQPIINLNMTNKTKNKKKKTRSKPTRLGYALRALGGFGGEAAGTYFGYGNVGRALGTSLGAALSKWLGSGSYSVQSNSMIYAPTGTIPSMHKSDQSVVIRHREYLGEIRGSKAFTTQRFFKLQPGNTDTFPWLSGIARQFSEYAIRGAVFHYVPTSGYAVSGDNPAIGSVMMQTTYRANDSLPTTKVEMLNEYWSSEGPPNEAFVHPIECSPKENPFSIHYIHTQPVPTGDSELMYDMGTTFVSTSGMPGDNNVVGDLWITYEIELKKPVVKTNLSSRAETYSASFLAPTTSSWFTTSTVNVTNTLGLTASGNTITFPTGTVGTYLVQILFYSSAGFSAIDLSGVGTLTNCTAVTLPRGVTYDRTVLTSGSVQVAVYTAAYQNVDPARSWSVTYPSATWTGTAGTCQLLITQLTD